MTDTRCPRCSMPMLIVDDPGRGRWAGCPRCGHTIGAALCPSWHHADHQRTCRSVRTEHGREVGM